MKIIEHQIQKGDTLQSIAEKYKVTIEELVSFHNQNSGITQKIIDNKIPIYLQKLLIDRNFLIPSIAHSSDVKNYQFKQNFSYRTEFVVGTKLENVLVDNSTYKSQFTVKIEDKRNYVYVSLDENHVTSSPQLVQKGMELIADVDRIKCNSVFQISPENGKILKILNYQEILNNWKQFKADFNSKKSVMSLSKSQKDIEDFFVKVESLIIPEQSLIKDYDTKMFYEVFFNSFLVGKGDFTESYFKTYYSTIFDQLPITLHFISTIIEENEDIVKVRRVSEMDKDTIDLRKIIKLYDERIKPMVKYSFSEYKYSIRETLIWNKKENILQDSHITVIEEVKNNVQLLIDFNLKMIE